MPLYKATFPKGGPAQIADLPTLLDFQSSWKFHHPLEPEQLDYSGRVSIIKHVGYYHGGDVLYWLEDFPGVWHECCLRSP